MKVVAQRRDGATAEDLVDRVICHDVRDGAGRVAVAKGTRLDGAAAERLLGLPWDELHLIAPEAGDLHEEEAGQRLAAAVVGDGVAVKGYTGGQWTLVGTRRGLLRVHERALTDVNQCLESTANIVWPMMKHLVVLDKEYQDLPAVSCYAMQLKQVFMNLLVNAYQAIAEKVGSSGGTGRIRLRTRRLPDAIEVQVEDDGAGIAPEHLGRIFDPFFTTKKVGVGTGLGLSTSYAIVRRHGGRIRVESRPGVGTLFRVHLPLEGLGEEEDEDRA